MRPVGLKPASASSRPRTGPGSRGAATHWGAQLWRRSLPGLLLAVLLALGWRQVGQAQGPRGSGETGDGGAGLFYEGTFRYVPSPTPEPEDPNFYRNSSFRFVPSPSAPSPPAAPAGTSTPTLPTTEPSPLPTRFPVATATPLPQAGPSRTSGERLAALEEGEAGTTFLAAGSPGDDRFYPGAYRWTGTGLVSAATAMPFRLLPADEPVEEGTASPTVASALPRLGSTRQAVGTGETWETLSPAYSERSPLPLHGLAMYYNPGIMREVLAYRLQMAQIDPCPECVGYVALLRRGDLNRKVWILWPDGTVEGPFLVVDVAARHHVSPLLKRGWAVDVDYQTALRHRMNRPLPVTVLAAPP